MLRLFVGTVVRVSGEGASDLELDALLSVRSCLSPRAAYTYGVDDRDEGADVCNHWCREASRAVMRASGSATRSLSMKVAQSLPSPRLESTSS